METSLTRKELDRFDETLQTWKGIRESTGQIYDGSEDLQTVMSQHLEVNMPEKLPVPASKQECLAAKDVLTKQYEAQLSSMQQSKNGILALADDLGQVLQAYLDLLSLQFKVLMSLEYTEAEDEELDECETALKDAEEYTCQFQSFVSFLGDSMDLGFYGYFLRHLMIMLEGQDLELKRWFVEYHGWGESVKVEGSKEVFLKELELREELGELKIEPQEEPQEEEQEKEFTEKEKEFSEKKEFPEKEKGGPNSTLRMVLEHVQEKIKRLQEEIQEEEKEAQEEPEEVQEQTEPHEDLSEIEQKELSEKELESLKSVSKSVSSNSDFCSKPDSSKPSKPFSDHIPSEIKHLIFSLADLESCVTLRQISKSWYTFFQDNEPLWEEKLGERNPWIQPGDPHLQSWGDCVLVFVSRLKNWPCEEDMAAFERPKAPPKCQSTVSVTLEPQEKLPSDFNGIIEHTGELCNSPLCEQLHCVSCFDITFMHIVDLKTNEVTYTRRPHEYHHLDYVHGTPDVHVFRFREDGVVLPASWASETTYFNEREQYLLVGTPDEEYALLLSKNNLHFDFGIKLKNNRMLRESLLYGINMEHVFMVLENDSPNDELKYLIADWKSLSMRPYTVTSSIGRPVAYYDGLIWLSCAYFYRPSEPKQGLLQPEKVLPSALPLRKTAPARQPVQKLQPVCFGLQSECWK
ncbi:hypothetical protein CJU90_2026 [Yarrowia sp. C11]|nr:hypothetical protein CJU90_2026 [Yarrowia sp. C11]